jgi:hypothetical protein
MFSVIFPVRLERARIVRLAPRSQSATLRASSTPTPAPTSRFPLRQRKPVSTPAESHQATATPIQPRVRPEFGQSSLTPPPPHPPPPPPSSVASQSVRPSGTSTAMDVTMTTTDVNEDEMMDWQPSPVSTPDNGRGGRHEVEFAPQRFFAPEEPTGLEGMFEKALGLDTAQDEETSRSRKGWQRFLWNR